MTKSSLLKTFTPYAAAAAMALSGVACTNTDASSARTAFNQNQPSPIGVLTADNFDEKVFSAPGLAIVTVIDPACDPCKAVEPLVEYVAREKKDHLKIYAINQDTEGDFLRALDASYKLGMKTVPFYAAFKNGRMISTMTHSAASGMPFSEAFLKWTDDAIQASRAMETPRPLALMSGVTTGNDDNFQHEVVEHKGLVLVNICSAVVPACRGIDIAQVARHTAGRIKVVDMPLEKSLGSALMLGAAKLEKEAGEAVIRPKVPAMLVLRNGEPKATIDPRMPQWQMIRVLEGVIDELQETAAAPPPPRNSALALK